MTDTVTTARQLWESGHPDFCALLRVWEKEKRCPFPLADLLLEHDLAAQSEAAKWAATYRERPYYATSLMYGPYPHVYSDDECYWYPDYREASFCDSVPHNASGCVNNSQVPYPSCSDAFVALLDNWRLVSD